MKKQFELVKFLSENREMVIAEYNKLQNEKFFNGISMKQFGLDIFKAMSNNNPRSEARAESLLPNVIGMVYASNSKCGVIYSTPYAESNHAKMANYHGTEKATQLSRI